MVDPSVVLAQVMNGLTFGFSIALVALGLSLIFGVMDIVNFAHGEFYMMGAFGIFLLVPVLNNFWLAVVVAALAVAVIGILVERLTIKPLRGRDPMQSLIVTFGLVLIFQQASFEVFGGEVRTVAAPIKGSVSFAGITYPSFRIFIILFSPIIIGIVYQFLQRTRIGVLIRASAQDLETARTLGVPADRIFMLTFGLSALLAGIAAGFLVPIRSIYPTMGGDVILDAFIIVIIGGLGSIPGVIVAALAIGLVQSLSIIWLPAFASEVVSFALLIAVLLVRPSGLFGGQGAGE
jgi:branched-chain amino acid transport system permease protein